MRIPATDPFSQSALERLSLASWMRRAFEYLENSSKSELSTIIYDSNGALLEIAEGLGLPSDTTPYDVADAVASLLVSGENRYIETTIRAVLAFLSEPVPQDASPLCVVICANYNRRMDIVEALPPRLMRFDPVIYGCLGTTAFASGAQLLVLSADQAWADLQGRDVACLIEHGNTPIDPVAVNFARSRVRVAKGA